MKLTQLGEHQVALDDQPGHGAKIVEHIGNLTGVEGARGSAVALAEPPLRSERRALEPEAENIGPAGSPLRLDPRPCRVIDDLRIFYIPAHKSKSKRA